MTDVATAPAPATDTAPAPDAAPATPNTVVEITVPHSGVDGGDDRKVLIDAATIPAEARFELLRSAVRGFVTNRVNVANVRRNKELAPWLAYEQAIAADPMQTAVAKPEGERPQPLDTFAKAQEALAALAKGEIRTVTKGTGKSRTPKDPLVAAVTPIVVRAVFDANKARDPKYTYPLAVKEVGGDGIAYLNKQIDAKVAAGADRAALEKARDEKYLNPARIMIGQGGGKKVTDLPSIL
jgi:hypothetical protein